ncbi:MAG: sulfatase-like hydrolase/transferase [Lachnospiraceae bacterium]|nr:sulfatase-like hydrolase/transferase [Lachnospiraceae bacterium]
MDLMKPRTKTLKRPKLLTCTTAIKYAFSAGLIAFAYSQIGDGRYLIAGYLELAAIFLISNALIRKKRIAGWVVNGILLLALNVQMAVLTFGNTYISLVMMTNLDSVQDLAGQAFVYGTAIASAVILSFLPAKDIRIKRTAEARLLALVLVCELAFTMFCGSSFSPIYAYWTLAAQKIEAQAPQRNIQAGVNYTEFFHNTTVAQKYKKPEELPENPNVIVIFTEGLSENIIEDKRHIMANVAAYENKSVHFENYYNHTFATYRALSGQLYSGYQLNNYDANSLISLQDILADKGYTTTFINTETRNLNFTNYLIEMGFDEVLSDPEVVSNGPADSISDKDAYELLYDTVVAQGKEDRPFFTAIYTFGTHTSLDSPDEVFGDGSDSILNKFYNLDLQFGKFMQKFMKSDLAENTVIFFTADHAAYQDRLFNISFPDYERVHTELDRIPFFIYYKGIEPLAVDVEGRNTLDFAPTVLDFLDISENNFFLGTTLFSGLDNNNNYDTIFADSAVYAITRGAEIRKLTDTEKNIIKVKLGQYYAAKSQALPE